MLNELEHLADKIARVLRHADALAAENQRLRAEVERLTAEAEVSKTERDAMVADRSVLNAKIEEAQLRIQSILDKLPTASDARQLDLLGEGAPRAASPSVSSHSASQRSKCAGPMPGLPCAGPGCPRYALGPPVTARQKPSSRVMCMGQPARGKGPILRVKTGPRSGSWVTRA